MADEDSSWMLDDNDTFATGVESEEVNEDSQETTVVAPPVEVPKPPAEWRKTYKKDVSNLTAY